MDLKVAFRSPMESAGRTEFMLQKITFTGSLCEPIALYDGPIDATIAACFSLTNYDKCL